MLTPELLNVPGPKERRECDRTLAVRHRRPWVEFAAAIAARATHPPFAELAPEHQAAHRADPRDWASGMQRRLHHEPLGALLVFVLLCWASCAALAGDAVPTIRSALQAADAATATHVPVLGEGIDEREARLRELEFRIERMRSAREQMQQALAAMASDPTFDRKVLSIGCGAAVTTFGASSFQGLVHAKLNALEEPMTFQQLTADQGTRLGRIKASLAEYEGLPDIDCAALVR